MLKFSRAAILSVFAMIVILVVMSIYKDKLQPQTSPATSEHSHDTGGVPTSNPAAILPQP